MSLYKRGNVWWYKFRFNGQPIRDSSHSQSKTVAREAERARRRQLEEGTNGIRRLRSARLFKFAADEWLDLKRASLSLRSVQIEKANLVHLTPIFGQRLLCDMTPVEISRYQQHRLLKGASPKTINLEIGTLRAILRKNRLWASLSTRREDATNQG